MEESIFEIMERTRFVDRVLLWLAILGPFAVATLLFLFRNRPLFANNRHHWSLVFLAGPLLLVMWKVYNAVVDHYGLDSVFGLFVNALIFLFVGILLSVLNVVLGRVLQKPTEADHGSG